MEGQNLCSKPYDTRTTIRQRKRTTEEMLSLVEQYLQGGQSLKAFSAERWRASVRDTVLRLTPTCWAIRRSK